MNIGEERGFTLQRFHEPAPAAMPEFRRRVALRPELRGHHSCPSAVAERESSTSCPKVRWLFVEVASTNPSITMSNPSSESFPADRELVLQRVLNAPREKLWRCWTEPALVVKWFTPAPWKTVRAEMDVRPGGSSYVVMQSPEGQEFPNPGIYLEVVPHEKLVFTDAFTSAWVPSEKPFMTGILTFEEAGLGKTRYTARVRHWTIADRETHEKMGFHTGWGIATDQLEALAKTL
jgi:uncharacterized protein YndB with AHSA1/START domain